MKLPAWSRHPKLLFRAYLLLVGGLLVTATVLDLGFAYLQTRLAPTEDGWLERSFRLIEADLAAAPAGSRDAAAQRLASQMGIGVQVLHEDDVATAVATGGGTSRLVDASGSVSYLRDAPAVGGAIRLGPVEPPRSSPVLDLIPPLFYVSMFVIVGLWLRPLLRDLDLMTDAARQFATDYRLPPATAQRTSRLTSLAQHFDDMSARLSSLIQTQKELAAALSHEMRTPLARIRFALAVARRAGSDDLGGQLDDINADVQELDQLIGAILDYARLDHPDLQMNWQQVPLDPWLETTLDRGRQNDKDVQIACPIELDTVPMDPRLMGLALSNLVANACRHANHIVRVSLAMDEHGYRLIVEDDGEGIPEGEHEAVFKAFTRLDTSRNRHTGGHGLGLAVVARVAALHGGDADVDDSPALGGARFTLRWPAMPGRRRRGRR